MRAQSRFIIVAAACAGALAVTSITSIALNAPGIGDTGRSAQAAEVLSVTEVDSPEEMDAAIGVEPPLQVREAAPTTPASPWRRQATTPRTPLVAAEPDLEPSVPAPAPAPLPAPIVPSPTPTLTPPASSPSPTPTPTPTPSAPEDDDDQPAPAPAPPQEDGLSGVDAEFVWPAPAFPAPETSF